MFQVKKSEPFFTRTITEHREKVANLTARFPHSDALFRDFEVAVNQNFTANIRVYRSPSISSAPLPTLFFIPGTAFVAKETDISNMICSHIAKISGAQVIKLDHRLAPEVKLPFILGDVFKLVNILIKIPDLNIDRKNLSISGYSTGANFAALCALAAPKLFRSAILLSPLVDLSRSLSQYKNFEQKDVAIKPEFVRWFLNHALPDKTKKFTHYDFISPYWASPELLAQLPKTSIVVAEFDRFRSDAEAFFSLIQSSGHRNVNLSRIPKENHGFLWNDFNSIELFAQIAASDLRMPSIWPSAPKLNHLFYIFSRENKQPRLKEKEEERAFLTMIPAA